MMIEALKGFCSRCQQELPGIFSKCLKTINAPLTLDGTAQTFFSCPSILFFLLTPTANSLGMESIRHVNMLE